MITRKQKTSKAAKETTLSVTEFFRSPQRHLKEAKRSKRPTVLTRAGRPSIVLMDAGVYARLARNLDTDNQNDRLRQSIAEAERGEGRPLVAAIDDLLKQYGG